MDTRNRARAKRSKLPKTKQTTASSTASHNPSMFNNAKNINIVDSSISMTTNINMANGVSLDVLYKWVASNAILNAGGRADEVRCHPGTREEVIGRIEKWANTQDGQTPPMFWLSGPAGAGKSAIVQTVAERCGERGVPQANFFFFRGDPSRSHSPPLIATLLYQIILLHPPLRNIVATALSINPLIFGSSLENQLEQLIITPLSAIPRMSTRRPLILLIDGLDECGSETNKSSQAQILRAFDKALTQHTGTCPFRVLVASRDESQIQVAFNKLSSQCLHLYLNDEYSPENDIRVFVNAQFEEVRKTHRLRHMLDLSWPPVKDVNYIVKKSSGQFIYAATVMRFISGSSASPMVSLERVQGIAQLATKSPFSHLDAIYAYILSQVDDQDVLKDILNAQLFESIVVQDSSSLPIDRIPPLSPDEIPVMDLLGCLNPRYTKAILLSCLEDLTPLMKYNSESDELLFYHASLSDYLLNQSRSGDYFVDTIAFSYKILSEISKIIDNGAHFESWIRFSIAALCRLPKLPAGVLRSMTSSIQSTRAIIPPLFEVRFALEKIYNMCISDDDIMDFRQFLRLWFNDDSTSVRLVEVIKAIPFASRYFYMARADHYFELEADMATALRPQSDFDRQELAAWLKELFDKIHNEVDCHDAKRYRLEIEWGSWADSNGIPYRDLDVKFDSTSKE